MTRGPRQVRRRPGPNWARPSLAAGPAWRWRRRRRRRRVGSAACLAALARSGSRIYTGRSADVAQLARASACHAEGRGFESLHPLHKKARKSGPFSFSPRVLRAQNRLRLPLSSTKPGIQTSAEGLPEAVEVINEVGFDEAQVAADLDAWDDAAAGVVAQRRLLEGEELGRFRRGQKSRVRLGGAAASVCLVRLVCVARRGAHDRRRPN